MPSAAIVCSPARSIASHRKTYHAWFGETPHSDVTEFATAKEFQSMICWPPVFRASRFRSQVVSKKNSLGGLMVSRTRLRERFSFILPISSTPKQPPVLLLENVKNLRSHNKGDTWRTISERLDEIGYKVFDKTIDAAAYVPQHRERIFIVGFAARLSATTRRSSFLLLPMDRRQNSRMF